MFNLRSRKLLSLLSVLALLSFSNTFLYEASAGYVKYSIYERTLPLMFMGEGGSSANLDYSSIVAVSSAPVEVKNTVTGKTSQTTYTNVTGSCTSITTGFCETSPYSGYLFLGKCLTTMETACVRKVAFDGESLQFLSYTNSKIIESNASSGFPGGRAVSIWKNSSNRFFALAPVVRIMGSGNNFRYMSFSVLLEEVVFTDKQYKRPLPTYMVNTPGNSEMHSGDPSDIGCYESGDSGLCIQRLSKLAGAASVTLHLDRNAPKWLTGRLSNFSASIYGVSTGGYDLTLNGEAQSVPSLAIKVEGEEFISYFKKLGATMNADTNLDFISNNQDTRSQMQQLIQYEEPTTIATKDYWLVNGSLQENMGDCFRSSGALSGYVMTNATIYPDLNPVVFNGDFEFQIISPHLDEFGQINTGSYDMKMSNELVRCLYKLGSNPYKASVSVLNIDGSQKVATTTVGERDGSLIVTAKNFTFSSPRIVVKVVPQAIKQVSIICIKGKLSKTVKGTNPKCPAGYKAK
ncbi:hypothetical protein MCEMRE182_00205 [Candidatus Nanopelagicaceae bacterium]